MKKNEKTVVCRIINQIPGLPHLPGGELPSGIPTELPSLPGGLDLGGVLGLGRTGVGPTQSAQGPTLGQLSRVFDPALVHLLVPGMVTR